MNRSEKEKMLAGEIYNPSDPELSRLAIEAKHKAYLLNQCDPSDATEYEKRLRSLFPLLGPNSYIAPNVQVDYGTVSDPYPSANGYVGSQPGPVSYRNRLSVFVIVDPAVLMEPLASLFR